MAGGLDKSNVHVCVDCTWSPLGRRATMGLLASCTLVMGALVVRKLLVAPESKIAHLLMVSMSMLTVQRSAAAASVYTGWGLGKKVIDCILNLYYSYCPPLPVRNCCTSPDWMEQKDPAGEEVLAELCCCMP
jgi:hypothetical protein